MFTTFSSQPRSRDNRPIPEVTPEFMLAEYGPGGLAAAYTMMNADGLFPIGMKVYRLVLNVEIDEDPVIYLGPPQ